MRVYHEKRQLTLDSDSYGSTLCFVKISVEFRWEAKKRGEPRTVTRHTDTDKAYPDINLYHNQFGARIPTAGTDPRVSISQTELTIARAVANDERTD